MTRTLLMAGLLLLFAALACAETDGVTQTVGVQTSEVAEISVTGNVAGLTIDSPIVGADVPADDTDSSTYLRFSSIVDAGKTRTIDATVTAGTLPAGTELYVTAATPGGGGAGVRGTTGGAQSLEPSAATLATSVGSCWTGAAGGEACNLTYRLTIDPAHVAALQSAAAGDITITWTLNDDQ